MGLGRRCNFFGGRNCSHWQGENCRASLVNAYPPARTRWLSRCFGSKRVMLTLPVTVWLSSLPAMACTKSRQFSLTGPSPKCTSFHHASSAIALTLAAAESLSEIGRKGAVCSASNVMANGLRHCDGFPSGTRLQQAAPRGNSEWIKRDLVWNKSWFILLFFFFSFCCTPLYACN